ncbi:MAG TPA: hypothetical protein VJX68_00140 [Candidatus Binatus sp.]|uniref:hypothetical protein n=1 Tax=Candidatus Binatus sp. TaxID=2811406 RepID=UPI002B47ACD1|nr:hypothetical protein [Candidatus Binatus sp.]HKN11580.1 hypothetical protein [Candidatus Binatus sp.]
MASQPTFRIRIALLITIISTFMAALSGCSTVNEGGGTAAAPSTSMQTLEYYPYQVKGYQNSYPKKTIQILIPADARDVTGDAAPLNGNPAIGVVDDQSGSVTERLYSSPLGPIVQQAIGRSADEAGMSASSSTGVAYKPGVGHTEYVLESKIRLCWVKKARAANGQYGPVWKTMADFSLDVSIYKPPFSVPFWTGTSNDTYFDPPVGSFGLGSEDEAGIYDEPGQVLSVALTRSVAAIFQRQDLRDLMLEDDVKSH